LYTVYGREWTFCRRYPPSPIYDPGALEPYLYQTAWPIIKPEYWCGEYSRYVGTIVAEPVKE